MKVVSYGGGVQQTLEQVVGDDQPMFTAEECGGYCWT